MKKSIFKKAGVFALSAMMAFTMCSANVFAAGTSGAYNSDHTDYIDNGTGNATASRQANSAKTTWKHNGVSAESTVGDSSGVVTLGKILTVNQQNKFPNIEDFVYKITPVSAWDNANVDTTKSGATIAKKDMPMPANRTTDMATHHQIITNGSGTNDWHSYVTLGNFKEANETNASSIENSDAASNTDLVNDNLRRTRTTDVLFEFTKAGYYMYKVEEVGSIKNGTQLIGGTEPTLRKDVAGVDYDNNTYYMVFYVANKEATENTQDVDEYGHGTKTGDTVGAEQGDIITDGAQAPAGGIYVHTITSWTNSQSTDNKAADLQDGDALNNAKDLMNTMDNGGEPAKKNTGKVDGNNTGVADGDPVAGSNGSNGVAGTTNPGVSTVTHDNLGKVGVTPPDNPPQTDGTKGGPNKLEAYRMWNAQTTHDVVLKKNVTGNLGDRTKQFEFTVVLTGLENNQTYTTNVQAGSTDSTANNDTNKTDTGDVTSSTVTLYEPSADCTLSQDKKSFTSSSTGTATFKVKLRDDEILVINSLPRSSSYQITEAASDHVPQYDIVSTNKATTGDVAVIGKNADKTKTASNNTLATGTEFVDRYDGTVTVVYQNNRDLATVTGVPGLDYILYAVIALLMGLAAAAIIRRKKAYAEFME